MDSLYAGVWCQLQAGFVHHRHRGNAQVNARRPGRGNHPGAADGCVCLSFQEQGIYGVVLRLPRHQRHKFQMIAQCLLDGLLVREGCAAIIDDGAAEAVNPGSRIVSRAVLLHKAIAASAGIFLHIPVQLLRGGRDIFIGHIPPIVHKQQCLKIQRQLVKRALIAGSHGHGEEIRCAALRQQGRDRGKNPHLRKHANFIVGKYKQIRRCVGVIAHQLQGIRQAGFLFKHNLQIRHGFPQIILHCRNHGLLFVMPDNQLFIIAGIAALCAASRQPQQTAQAQNKCHKSLHSMTPP